MAFVFIYYLRLFVCFLVFRETVSKNSFLKGPPSLLSERNSQKKAINEGKDVKLTCPVAGNPEPIFEWSKGGEAILDEDWERFRVVKNSLKIKEVKAGDQGTYVCKAVNGFGSVRYSFYLTVLAPFGSVLTSLAGDQLRMDQVFPVSGSSLRKITGQSIRFKCLATGDPSPEITWLKDGLVIEPSAVNMDGDYSYPDMDIAKIMQHSLPLTNLKQRDSGNYTCLASNIHGVVSANWTLNVVGGVTNEGPDVFPLEMSNVTSFSGEDAVLTCKGNWDSDVTPKVMWLRQISKETMEELPQNQTFPYMGKHYQVLQPTELLLLENRLFMTKLVINDVEPGDSGLYFCTVSNRYGINFRQANLTVIETDSNRSLVLLLSGLAMSVIVIIVVAVAVSICRKKSKPSAPPGPTERALIPPAMGPSHSKLQPAPPSHQQRYVIHHPSNMRTHTTVSTESGVVQYPPNVVHLTTQIPQGTENSAGGQEQPIIIYQDPNLAGSVYLASHQPAATTAQPTKYEYRQFDVI